MRTISKLDFKIEFGKFETIGIKPDCKKDCLNYNNLICKTEGRIDNGYDEYGCLCCPVFEGKFKGIYKGLRY